MFPKIGQGYSADVKVGNRSLRLKSEVCETGPVALVYDLKAKCEIDRENVPDLQAGKVRAEEVAASYLFKNEGSKMPQIVWKKNS